MNSYNGPWMWVSEKFLRAVEKHTSDYVRAAVDPSPCPRTWIGSRISAALQECKKTSKSCKNIYKFIKSSQIGESGTLTFADELTVVLSVLVEGALKESAMDGACGEEGEQECPDQLYTAMLHDLMPNGYVIKRDGLLLLYKITVSDLLRSDP